MDSRGASLEPPFCQRWGRRCRRHKKSVNGLRRSNGVMGPPVTKVNALLWPNGVERPTSSDKLGRVCQDLALTEASISPSALAEATVAWLSCGAVVEVEACFSPCQCTVPSSCRIGRGSGSAIFEAKYASACLVSSSSVLSFAMRSSMIFCRQFICKWPGVLQ